MFENVMINGLVVLAIVVNVVVVGGLGFLLAFKLLGIRRYFPRAEEPTLERMREATRSYMWLGTSAYYVISYGRVQDLIREKKSVKIRFVTIDPECDAVLEEHAKWQKITKYDLKKRIEISKKVCNSLREDHGCNIAWLGQGQLPAFRVVIIDDEKILVSFYESGTKGPDAKQFELEADSLLGRWFKGYFDKCYWTAEQRAAEAQEQSPLDS